MVLRRRAKLKNYQMPSEMSPICPHCEREVQGLVSRQINSDAGRAFVWACPKCAKIVGVTQRSGYILG